MSKEKKNLDVRKLDKDALDEVTGGAMKTPDADEKPVQPVVSETMAKKKSGIVTPITPVPVVEETETIAKPKKPSPDNLR